MNIYASQLVRANYPAIAGMKELKPDETGLRRLYVLSPEDMPSIKGLSEADATDVLRDYLEKNHPVMAQDFESLGSLGSGSLRRLAASLQDGVGVCSRFNMGAGRWDAVMTARGQDHTKETIAASWSGVGEDLLGALPGTDEQWRNVSLLHELGHAVTLPNEHTAFKEEVVADAFAFNNLGEVFADAAQHAEITQVIHAFHAMRALGSFKNIQNHAHVTSAALVIGGEQEMSSAPSLDFLKASAVPRATVGQYFREATYSTVHGSKVLHEMLKGEFSAEDAQIVKDMQAHPVDVDALAKGLSEEGRNVYFSAVDTVKDELMNEELRFLNRRYSGLREAYLNGDFDGDLIAKQYAYEYLDAAQNYAASSHHANPDEQFEAPVLVLDKPDIVF